MSVDMKMMNFRIADSDRALLEGISRYYSDASMSAILRRLIRNEAKTIGISVVEHDEDTEADRKQEPVTA